MIEINDLRDRIGHVDGGELTSSNRACPYSIIFPSPGSRAVVYTTKIHVARCILAWPGDDDVSIGIIGRYGLTGAEDLSAISAIVGDRPLHFLGDCDPFDLLVFAWIRRLRPILFLGTADRIVSALGVEMTDRNTIPLADDEQRAMSLVREMVPDYEELVGPRCSELLGGNRKIEMEALFSFRTLPNSGLLGLLQ
jgi:hypothetical protein